MEGVGEQKGNDKIRLPMKLIMRVEVLPGKTPTTTTTKRSKHKKTTTNAHHALLFSTPRMGTEKFNGPQHSQWGAIHFVVSFFLIGMSMNHNSFRFFPPHFTALPSEQTFHLCGLCSFHVCFSFHQHSTVIPVSLGFSFYQSKRENRKS